jgi:hypothetical protein
MDLLTRAACFGYVGSTFNSLVYAPFTFIFLAVETAIMAQAIKPYFGMPLWLGYILIGAIFVCVSELKVNVTNAYAGSLAWSNFFSRVTHSHPGLVVWLVFNCAIVLLLMELDLFEATNSVLALLIAYVTKGKYYIARRSSFPERSNALVTCGICEHHYAEADSAYYPHHGVNICSLCCTLDPNCKDVCKPKGRSCSEVYRDAVHAALNRLSWREISGLTAQRVATFTLIWGCMLLMIGVTL